MGREKIAVIAMFAALVSCAVELPDPIVRFAMDAVVDGKIADISGNGRDMTLGASLYLTNGPTAGSSALYYDGTTDAWATFPCPALATRTVAFWMYREATDGPIDASVNKFPYFLSGLSTMRLMTTANTQQMRVALGTQDITANYPINGTSPTATRGEWSHYVFSVEDTGTGTDSAPVVNFSYWKNGVLQVSTANFSVSTTISVAGTAIVGNDRKSGSRPIYGALADFRVYDVALTTTQARALYVQSRRDLCGGAELLAWWPMERFVTNGVDGFVYTPDASGFNAAGRTSDMNETNGWMRLSADTVLTNGPCGTDRAVFYTGTAATWSRGKMPCGARETTWSMWINPSRNSTIFRVAGQDKNFPHLMLSEENNLRFYLQSGLEVRSLQCQTLGPSYIYPVFGTAFAARETWSHLVFVDRFEEQNGTQVHRPEVWLNGELTGVGASYREAAESSWLSVGGNITFGNTAHNNSGNRPYEGAIADIRVYGGNLTSNEIVRLYRSAAKADAGVDFAVAAETAVLRGKVAARSGKPHHAGYDGSVEWSLISAPNGVDGVAFARGSNPVTEVTLPVEGTYTFRLTVTGFDGTASSDEVNVVRVAASAGNVAPTVSVSADSADTTLAAGVSLSAAAVDPDSSPGVMRLWWSRVSGPGGVWFQNQDDAETLASFSAAGTYVLRCTAEDGQDSAYADVTVTVALDDTDLSVGLQRHWKCDVPNVLKEEVSGSTSAFTGIDYNGGMIGEGVSGYGFRNVAHTNIFLTTVNCKEGVRNTLPTNEWLTVCAWLLRETANTNSYFCAPWFAIPYTLYLDYGKYVTPKSWTQQAGLTLMQQAVGGYSSFITYDLPYSFDDRWTHVCAAVNRWEIEKSEMWVDGVKLSPASVSVAAVDGGRARDDSVRIGGMQKFDEVNGVLSPASNLTTHVVGHRTFPGTIDDVRVYVRKLSESEIKRLARKPVTTENLAPLISDASVSAPAVRRRPLAATADTFDDGNPSGAAVTCEWEVVGGDSSAVAFADASVVPAAVTFGKVGSYMLRLKVSDGERVSYGKPIAVDVLKPGITIHVH